MTGDIQTMLNALFVALSQTRAGKNLLRLKYHKDPTGEWVEIDEATDNGGVTRRDISIEGNSGAATIIAIVKEVM